MKNDIYYSNGELLSHRMFYNFLNGNRGGGKTYNFKNWCVKDAIKNGKQFVWLRRYAEEIRLMKNSFFDDFAKNFPKNKFEVKGSKKKGEFYCDDKVIGYYFALSTGSIAKSSSYPLVDKIVFDEFLIMGNTYRYLSDEVTLMLEFTETIFRDRETQKDAVKPRGVYFIGNNITTANPYYLYFNLKPKNKRFYVDKERGICVEQYTNEKFVEIKKTSRIGKLTQGTKYAEYAIENKSYLDNDRFIRKKPQNATFHCAIDYKNKTYGFWLDYKNGEMYVNLQYDPYTYNRYSLTRNDHTINTFLIKNLNNTYIKNIIWLFRNGCLFFEDVQIKAQVYEILSYFVR